MDSLKNLPLSECYIILLNNIFAYQEKVSFCKCHNKVKVLGSWAEVLNQTKTN